MERKILQSLVAGACLALAGLGIYGALPKEYSEIENAIYQGHTIDEGRTWLVFDSLPKKQREDKRAGLKIWGNPEALKLKIGENYNLFISRNWFGERVVGATPTTRKE